MQAILSENHRKMQFLEFICNREKKGKTKGVVMYVRRLCKKTRWENWDGRNEEMDWVMHNAATIYLFVVCIPMLIVALVTPARDWSELFFTSILCSLQRKNR